MKIIIPSRDYPVVVPQGIPTNEFHGWMQAISDAVNNFDGGGGGGCDDCATKEQGERADIAYADRLKWDGSPMDNPAAGRASLLLGSAATRPSTDFATYVQGQKADIAYTPDNVPQSGKNLLLATSVEQQKEILGISGEVDGFFVPNIVGLSASGSAVYSAQHGYYKKTGSLVFVSIVLEWISAVGMSGQLMVSGLPFLCSLESAFVAQYLGWNMGLNRPYAYVVNGENRVYIRAVTSAGALSGIEASTVNGGGRVVISGQYVTG